MMLFSFFSFFFCKQKTAYEMCISDWSSDVCSSDLGERGGDRADDEEQHDRRDDRRQRVRHRLGRGGLHQNRQAEIEEVEAVEPQDRAGLAAARHDLTKAHEPCRGRRIGRALRSAERRNGKEVVEKTNARWSPYQITKQINRINRRKKN